MTDGLDALVEQATRSELFTSPRLAPICAASSMSTAPRRSRSPPRPASAGSTTRLLHRQRRLVVGDVLGQVPRRPLHDADDRRGALLRADLAQPQAPGPGSLVFAASYSGETEDTVAALRHAQGRGRLDGRHRSARRTRRIAGETDSAHRLRVERALRAADGRRLAVRARGGAAWRAIRRPPRCSRRSTSCPSIIAAAYESRARDEPRPRAHASCPRRSSTASARARSTAWRTSSR